MAKKTQFGEFRMDREGAWHYEAIGWAGRVFDPVCDALENRPKKGPAWFWFNGTVTAMKRGDRMTDLYERWRQWRKDYQGGRAVSFYAHLEQLFESTKVVVGA